ncbi:class I SAM-dependent methyltransferase [Bosea thiooxidans]
MGRRQKRVLHVGCGSNAPHRLHAVFRQDGAWDEIRVDVDPSVNPDVICSATNMRKAVADGSVDAIWSSHTIEHLHDHEVTLAVAEFRRVLKPNGFVLIRCPDLMAVVEAIQRDGLESVAYVSPAGPITPLDMLYGHRPPIARGNAYMAHNTAFTDDRIARVLIDGGFGAVYTKRAPVFDLWAVAFLRAEDAGAGLSALSQSGLDFTR